MRRNGIRASLGDRWLLLGTSGSGKTTAGRLLSDEYTRLFPGLPRYFVDSKAMGDFDRYGPPIISQAPPKLSALRAGVQVWQPPRDDLHAYDSYFEQLVKGRRPALVFIDELSSIGGRRGDDYPDHFIRCLKQGRGIGIVVIVLSQAVQGMPHETLDQISHILRFRLQSPYGGWYVDNRMLGIGRSLEPSSAHGFWYLRPGSNPLQAVEYTDIQQLLRKAA